MSKIAEGVRVDARIEEGNVKMSVTEDNAFLYFNPEDRTPLSVEETHATISVPGSDSSVNIELDGRQIDALADALHDYQEELQDRK